MMKFEPGEIATTTNGHKVVVIGYDTKMKQKRIVVRDVKNVFHVNEKNLIKSSIPQILGWADKYVNIFNTKGKHFTSVYITNGEYHFSNFSNEGLKVIYVNDECGCIQKVVWKDDPSEYNFLKMVFHC